MIKGDDFNKKNHNLRIFVYLFVGVLSAAVLYTIFVFYLYNNVDDNSVNSSLVNQSESNGNPSKNNISNESIREEAIDVELGNGSDVIPTNSGSSSGSSSGGGGGSSGGGDPPTCVPDCLGKTCGSDGCGGSCGECDDSNECTEDSCDGNNCLFESFPDGTICSGGSCKNGTCVSCVSDCVVYNVSISEIGSNYVILYWESNEEVNVYVEYGMSENIELSNEYDNVAKSSGNITLSGLSSGKIYYFRLIGEQSNGNLSASDIYNFTTAIPVSLTSSILSGGLVEYPVPMLSSNLLTNFDFEVNGSDNEPENWSSNGFEFDSDVSRSGNGSYRITDANLIQYAQSAYQNLYLEKGSYRISGWVKMDKLAENTGNGVRISLKKIGTLDSASTLYINSEKVNNSNDWHYLESINAVVPEDAEYSFRLECYSEPDGTAWFDDVELRREISKVIDVFMLYPNYRGMLFDDQTPLARFNITFTEPENFNLGEYKIQGEVIDESDESLLDSFSYDGIENKILEIDFSSYELNKTYLVYFKVVRKSDEAVIYEHPGYRIAKVSGNLRDSMTISYDEDNRFLVRGEPTFIIGMYDSGMGYASNYNSWLNKFNEDRRLFELPLNFYINYWYGNAGSIYMNVMMDVLQDYGVLYFQTGNAFNTGYNRDFLILTSDDYVKEIANNSGFAGFYIMDEAISDFAPIIFEDYQRFKALDPDGATLAVANKPLQLGYWRDNVDILAMDPYPMYGAEPSEGYPFDLVANQTILTRSVLMDSRPFIEALQFFQFTSKGRWPTESELRSMTYMAIVDGANGVFYWSLGAGALAYVCPGWCEEKNESFDNLKSVTNEIKAIEDVLVSIDRPDLLLENNNSEEVHTRVKYFNDSIYLLTYNYKNKNVSANFTFNDILDNVIVYNESRTIVPDGKSFSDSYDPFEAHVYIISTGVGTSMGSLSATENETINDEGFFVKIFNLINGVIKGIVEVVVGPDNKSPNDTSEDKDLIETPNTKNNSDNSSNDYTAPENKSDNNSTINISIPENKSENLTSTNITLCIDEDNDCYNVSITVVKTITGKIIHSIVGMVTGEIDDIDCGPLDCDDNNSLINPGMIEVCDNYIDDNCNGVIDCNDSECSGSESCLIENNSEIPQDYISYWRFEDNANDENGISDGYVVGNSDYVSGVVGDSIRHKVNGSVIVDSDSLDDLSKISISSWVNVNDIESDFSVIDKARGDYSWDKGWKFSVYGLYSHSGALRFQRDGNTDLYVISESSVIDINKWYHIVLTWDGSVSPTGVKFYVDGEEINNKYEKTGVDLFSDADRTAFIGGKYNFDGMIDEVIIYDRVLDSSEVRDIYCSQGKSC